MFTVITEGYEDVAHADAQSARANPNIGCLELLDDDGVVVGIYAANSWRSVAKTEATAKAGPFSEASAGMRQQQPSENCGCCHQSPIDGDNVEEVVAANVRERRARAGMSQRQVAELMTERGVSWVQSTVAKVEAACRPLRVDELVFLARVLRVKHPSELLESPTP